LLYTDVDFAECPVSSRRRAISPFAGDDCWS
jgi:hypothetical protein